MSISRTSNTYSCPHCGFKNREIDLNMATSRTGELEMSVEEVLQRKPLVNRSIYFVCNNCEVWLEFSYKKIHKVFGDMEDEKKFIKEY